MGQDIWQDIEALHQKFLKLGIGEAVDYEKYYLYSIIAHSTAIEGSTLTEIETQLLFDEGVVAGGKPLVYHLMNEDLKKAYELAKEEARHKTPITSSFLQTLNAALMRTTGSVHNAMCGSFDSSKVPTKVTELCSQLQERINAASTIRGQYELSFNAHLNLVTIHPWADGNGRTSRLLMNYIQFLYNLFPTKIFKEDREEYILALRQSQKEGGNLPFLAFMARQLEKSLCLEIERFNASQKKGFSFMF